jgi:nicotinamidase-related amidase
MIAYMDPLKLDPARTALVVIDLQKGIVATPSAPHSSEDVVRRSAHLAKLFREKEGTVVYVRVDMANILSLPVDAPFRAPDAPPPPASASEIVPESGFEEDDVLITKRHWGAFAGTELEQILRKRGVDTVVITGISTNAGVESTVRQGTGLGFAFVVVEDACSARDANDHRHSVERIFPRLAKVRKTEEVIAALGN